MIQGDARSIMQLKKLIARMADPRLSNLDAELVLESRSLITKFENKLSELATGQPTETERMEVRDLAKRVFKVMQEAYQISTGNYAASLGKEVWPELSSDEILDRELDPAGIRKLGFMALIVPLVMVGTREASLEKTSSSFADPGKPIT